MMGSLCIVYYYLLFNCLSFSLDTSRSQHQLFQHLTEPSGNAELFIAVLMPLCTWAKTLLPLFIKQYSLLVLL